MDGDLAARRVEGAGRARGQVEPQQVVFGTRRVALEERLLAVAADVGEEPRLGIAIHLSRRARRAGRDCVHRRARLADAARAEVDGLRGEVGHVRVVALHRLARRQLHRRRAIEGRPPDGPLLVRAVIAAEEQRLAVGRRHGQRDPLLRFEEPPGRRLGTRSVRHVELRKAVTVGDEDDLLAVAREEGLGVDERVHQGLRLLRQLGDARSRRARGRIGSDERRGDFRGERGGRGRVRRRGSGDCGSRRHDGRRRRRGGFRSARRCGRALRGGAGKGEDESEERQAQWGRGLHGGAAYIPALRMTRAGGR